MQIAANQGYGPAMNMYGIYLENGIGGYKNLDEAFKYYLASTSDEYVPGIYNLARCSFYGIGTTVDKASAFKLFLKASERGYYDASFMIGYMYSYGDGINQDKQKAKEYFKQAANKGMKEAIEELNKLDKEV